MPWSFREAPRWWLGWSERVKRSRPAARTWYMPAVTSRSKSRSIALAVPVGVFAPAAYGTVAERVVAVVGDHAILLSDMRQRARPYLARIQTMYPPGAQQAAAQSQLYKDLLQRMVDERVEQQPAEKAHITVTTDDIAHPLPHEPTHQ